jgi:hypothetical protein
MEAGDYYNHEQQQIYQQDIQYTPNGMPAETPVVKTRTRIDTPAVYTVTNWENWSPFVWFSLPLALFLAIAAIMYFYGGSSHNNHINTPPSPLMDD